MLPRSVPPVDALYTLTMSPSTTFDTNTVSFISALLFVTTIFAAVGAVVVGSTINVFAVLGLSSFFTLIADTYIVPAAEPTCATFNTTVVCPSSTIPDVNKVPAEDALYKFTMSPAASPVTVITSSVPT